MTLINEKAPVKAEKSIQIDAPIEVVWRILTSTIHTVESFEYFGWRGKAFGAYAIHNWKLTKLNGKTEVYVAESMEGFLIRLFRGFMKNTLDKSLENWLIYLKKEAVK